MEQLGWVVLGLNTGFLEEFLPAVLCSLFALWSPDGLS